MAEILVSYSQIEEYRVPDSVARKGKAAVADYIFDKMLSPLNSNDPAIADWEIVQIDLDSDK